MQTYSRSSSSPFHPRTVALVRVKKATNVNKYEIGYSVKINKIFKVRMRTEIYVSVTTRLLYEIAVSRQVNTKSSYTVLKKNILWTASSDALCGVDLKVGETYVVSGSTNSRDKARIPLCGISMPWRLVTSRQRKGFKHLYRFGCSCSVSKSFKTGKPHSRFV